MIKSLFLTNALKVSITQKNKCLWAQKNALKHLRKKKLVVFAKKLTVENYIVNASRTEKPALRTVLVQTVKILKEIVKKIH